MQQTQQTQQTQQHKLTLAISTNKCFGWIPWKRMGRRHKRLYSVLQQNERERERERGERGEREREREREPRSSLKSGEIGVIAQKLSPVPLDGKMCVHFIKIVYFFAQA
jgi:hypothetical protein